MKSIQYIFTLSLIAIFSMNSSLASSYYKWTDSKGNVHYSSKKPAKATSNVMNLKYKKNRNIESSKINALLEQLEYKKKPTLNNCFTAKKYIADLKKGGKIYEVYKGYNRTEMNYASLGEKHEALEQLETLFLDKCKSVLPR